MLDKVNVLILAPFSQANLERLRSLDPRLNVINGRREFTEELRQDWPFATSRYLPSAKPVSPAEAEAARLRRDALLAEADVLCIGFPYPLRVLPRAPRLKWVHQVAAGASNLHRSDLWGASIPVTTGRGQGALREMAEWVVGTLMALAKELPHAWSEKQSGDFQTWTYHPLLVKGKTMGIIGLGGIGREVAALARALEMRVIATRRSVSAAASNVEGVDELLPASDLPRLLAESDFIAICAQSTRETRHLLGEREFSMMKERVLLANVARGEIIDEEALVRALQAGRVGGAALDVYEGEFDGPPRPELLAHPNVILTPHTASLSDASTDRNTSFFCENLQRFLAGEELLSRIDWERGY